MDEIKLLKAPNWKGRPMEKERFDFENLKVHQAELSKMVNGLMKSLKGSENETPDS